METDTALLYSLISDISTCSHPLEKQNFVTTPITRQHVTFFSKYYGHEIMT